MDIDQDKKNDQSSELSVQDFLNVGLDQVAYIRCSEPLDMDSENGENGEDVYVVYAADGSQISVMDSYDTAVAAIRINDLFPVTLQ